MPKLVKDGEIIENTWTLIAKPEGDPADCVIPDGKVIVPLSVWLAQKAQLQARDNLGVWLESTESAHQLGDDARSLPLIAVNFPLFTDGRSFSNARLLRERYNFTGELRAIGNFIRDQLFYLRRCGVNAFAFANEDIDLESVLPSLNDFTEYYQAAVVQPVPLFRRRA
jgi:uncharacterized protein (DUF934 family)